MSAKNDKFVTLSEIAKSVKVAPKVARRRMRASKFRKPARGWVFPSDKRAAIAKIIKG